MFLLRRLLFLLCRGMFLLCQMIVFALQRNVFAPPTIVFASLRNVFASNSELFVSILNVFASNPELFAPDLEFLSHFRSFFTYERNNIFKNSPQRHREHKENTESLSVKLRELCVSVVNFFSYNINLFHYFCRRANIVYVFYFKVKVFI